MVSMRCALPLLAVFCLDCASARQAPAGIDTPLTWTDIEVVTDRDDWAPAIRAATRLRVGERIALSDERLPAICRAVRTAYPGTRVQCLPITNGQAEAMYVVELEAAHQRAAAGMPCDGASGLPADLSATSRRLFDEDASVLRDKSVVQQGEFINDARSLDNHTSALHAIDVAYADAVSGRLAQLTAATTSCDARQRADAIHLMNFVGDARVAVRYAAAAMDDPDATVRNNAFRLLGSFAAFVDVDTVSAVVQGACRTIERVSFVDRNKGLTALQSLIYKADFPAAKLPATCVQTVRHLAATSHSWQIGAPAKFILQRVDLAPMPAP